MDRDIPNIREVEVGKNKLLVKREDPYGFWHVNYERGVTPQDLSGAYTSAEQALAAIEIYLKKKNPDK